MGSVNTPSTILDSPCANCTETGTCWRCVAILCSAAHDAGYSSGHAAGLALGLDRGLDLSLDVIGTAVGDAVRCRVCGCTKERACTVLMHGELRGCSWSAPGLCSACAGVDVRVLGAVRP